MIGYTGSGTGSSTQVRALARGLFAAVALSALLIGWTGCREPAGPGAAEGKAAASFVVLVTVDGLVPQELAPFGGGLAVPNLQRLADAGRAWGDGWTTTPMSRPAVATYLTGLAPDRHGVLDDLFTSLEQDVPTLATRLTGAGYRTAAFPDSSLLGFSSGLLGGFEVVDDPPALPVSPARWVPETRAPEELAADFESWVDGIQRGQRYFAWFHFSRPMVEPLVHHGRERPSSSRNPARAKGGEAGPPAAEPPPIPPLAERQAEAVAAWDDALGRILAVLDDRGEVERSLVVVAGTQGDPGGGPGALPGPGFSLHENAIRVPVVARFPEGVASLRSPARAAWAPDVPRTIAGLTGTGLAPEAEGVSLLEEPAEDRVLLAWSWAPRDQMGWKAMRAARSGDWKRLEGMEFGSGRLDDASVEVEAAIEERLAASLSERADPQAPALDLETVAELLRGHEVELDPAPPGGRDFGPHDKRREAVDMLWNGRVWAYLQTVPRALISFSHAVDADPQAMATLLDRGQLMVLVRNPKSGRPLGKAVSLYPSNPEVLHWYAHSLWSKSLDSAEQILLAVLPYKRDDVDVLYDLACARSLANDLPASEEYLRAALEAGFKQWNLMEADADLRNLRESGRFATLMQEFHQ